MATCVIDKIQSRRCLTAVRNKLLHLPQTEKLTRSDKAVIIAIMTALEEGQIEEWEVTGTVPWLQPIVAKLPTTEDYGVQVVRRKPKTNTNSLSLLWATIIVGVVLVSLLLCSIL